MSDPLRTDPTQSPEPHGNAERDAKIESLLLAGLDHYFSSDYTQAIDVWTRALFLDRNHARARAYIERARSALAEQQRESEELLHTGIAAFESGQIESARQLLNAAVQRGGAHDVALAFLTRIDRISAAAPAAPARPEIPAAPTSIPVQTPRRSSNRMLIGVLAAASVTAVVVYAAGSWPEIQDLFPALGSPAPSPLAPVVTVREPLIVPRSSDLALERAKALFAGGRLHDALRALDLVRPTDPLRSDADRLKETIQRELIAHAPSPQ